MDRYCILILNHVHVYIYITFVYSYIVASVNQIVTPARNYKHVMEERSLMLQYDVNCAVFYTQVFSNETCTHMSLVSI